MLSIIKLYISGRINTTKNINAVNINNLNEILFSLYIFLNIITNITNYITNYINI